MHDTKIKAKQMTSSTTLKRLIRLQRMKENETQSEATHQ
jgi:hypothetical protein